MNRLTHVHIEGLKSIREADLDLRPLNVLIGANASGKSSFLSLFRMLSAAMEDGLQLYVGRCGGAEALLHYGSKTTPQMSVTLDWQTQEGARRYRARLVQVAPDTLALASEQVEAPGGVSWWGDEHSREVRKEAGLLRCPASDDPLANEVACIANWRSCHLNDTSETAAARKQCYKEDNRCLQADAGNLAAYLYLLRETARPYYDRIVRTVQFAFPELDDLDVAPLELNPNNVMLNWREIGRDKLFGPHDLSDGTLRFVALTTLLLQPEERLPELIVIDEPELGLHPYAISLLGGMLRSVSEKTQVIVATQSVALVDEFEPEDIVVTQRCEGATTFERLNPEALAEWLEDYSVSELWEKNVIGGRP